MKFAWNTFFKQRQTLVGMCRYVKLTQTFQWSISHYAFWNFAFLPRLNCFFSVLCVVFRFKGLRDDLTCLLDEDLTSMCLCALHCEMRNTEQLLKSVGLLAHEIYSLAECNKALKKYGRENFKGDRITVKLRTGQQTAASRSNISLSSFSGECIGLT